MKSTLVVDLDGTLTHDDASVSYENKLPRVEVIAKLREWAEAGYEIVIFTARNMRTFDGDLEQIEVHTVPVIRAWLHRHGVPYDNLIVGKPWCGPSGFYIDDRAIRPDEFASMTREQVQALVTGV